MYLYNSEFEKEILGGILQANSAIDRAGMKASDFHEPQNQKVYKAIEQVLSEGLEANLLTVVEKLGGMSDYVSSLTDSIPTAANIEYYAERVKDLSRRRRLQEIGAQIAKRAGEENEDPFSLQSELDEAFLATGDKSGAVTFGDYVKARSEWDPTQYFRPKMFRSLPFPRGTTSYIGARTGRGKSAALVNLGREAIGENKPVLFVTFELSPYQLIDRFILSFLKERQGAFYEFKDDGLPPWAMGPHGRPNPTTALYHYYRMLQPKNTGGIPEEIYNTIRQVEPFLNTRKLQIIDVRGYPLQAILNAIRRHESELVLIDYIQKLPPMVGDEGAPRYVQMKNISQKIVDLSVRTERIFVAAAQFHRTGKDDGEDTFSDASFREAGDLEQDAHNAIGIGWRENHITRFYRVLKARESNHTGDEYNLGFDGAYCHMSREEKSSKERKSANKDFSYNGFVGE